MPRLHPALVLLLKLRLRGLLRTMRRQLRSVRHAILFLLGLLFFLQALLMPLLSALSGARAPLIDPETVRGGMSFLLLAVCVLQLIAADRDGALMFSPAEVDHLFPGPFSRRQLLLYKLLTGVGGLLITAFLFACWLAPLTKSWWMAFSGCALGFTFIYQLQLAIALARHLVAARTYTITRKVVLVLVLLALAAVALQTQPMDWSVKWADRIRLLRDSGLGAAILLPFDAFGRIVTAQRWWPDFALWAGAGAGLNLLVLLLVLRLDANYLEASLNRSQKVYERLQRIRSSGQVMVSASVNRAGWRPPMPPRWAGAGPIAWRQFICALRKLSPWLLLLLLLAPLVMGLTLKGNHPYYVWIALGLLFYLSAIFFPMQLPFDFRSELDHVDALKSLPLAPNAVVVGEIATPVFIATALQWLVLAGLVAGGFGAWGTLAAAALLALPFNLLLFGIENLAALLFPVRLPVGGTDVIQSMARQLLLMFGKLFVLAIAGGLGGGIGVLVYFVAGQSMAAAVLVGGVVLALLAVAQLPLVGWAFQRFDPSRDLPP